MIAGLPVRWLFYTCARTIFLAQVPAGRMGDAGEIGSAVLYLASAEAGYVMGATLHVNGGMAML